MMDVQASAAAATDTRVVVLTPTARDYALLAAIFERHGIASTSCADLDCACAELARGAGALLVAEEFLTNNSVLLAWLHAQPPWSDLPILVMARRGTDYSAPAVVIHNMGNVTILDRPTHVANLVSAVQSALRARKRQYQIREHLAEQRQSEEQLRANDQRKDEFLAILAHELRNPLAPISNGLQILNLTYAEDTETAPVREIMERQVNNMRRLVDDLLEVSRVTRGQLELRVEQAELAKIVQSAIDVSAPLIAASQHRLEVVLPEPPVFLQADVVRLAQVIANLLNNAAKYTSPGGHIRLAVTKTGEEVVISVTDNGVGIPVDLQPKIFDMFMQVDASRNRSQGGLGIGLTLVKRLVELHGGGVEVTSAGAGQGSCFTVRLPVGAGPKAARAPGSGRSRRDLAGLKVLIVDDNRDAADTLGQMLRRMGVTVWLAYGGPEALKILESTELDAAILDIGMPDMDGLEVARRVRTQIIGAGLMLIALTGWGQRQDILNTQNAGFNHHLTKPVDVPRLADLLSAALPSE
jgi:signal transduction histidine kinase/CheY-like chemotaxis protein